MVIRTSEKFSSSVDAMPNSAHSTSSQLHLGAAYYPEHWPEERWPEDIRLMQEAGLSVVRMAEFAWSAMEPAEAKFDLAWLERAINLLSNGGIVSVLGTPTATPPAWMVQKYPDLLAVDENNRRVQFGNRCHYCVNSPDFHAAVRRLVTAMAERFGNHPSVVGWQIDNEYNRVCYCDRCRRLFQEFLQKRYGSLETLNEHWATRYWSETYSAWDQIPLPIGPHNPGLMLEFKHFITFSYRQFQKLQLDILHQYLRPGVWVTHNFMGLFDGFDHYEMTRDLDIASWDWYVGTGHHDYLTSGAVHDLTRGFKRKNFWLMETQPGHVNWAALNNDLNKGEMRAMAWHAVAHGADAVLYWQWRSAMNGQEQYHGALLDQSGQPRPLFEEVQKISRDFKAATELLGGSTVKSDVAMLNCYDSRWSIHWQRHHKDFQYEAHFGHYYRPLAARNINVDVISADESLDGYALVIAPSLLILTQKRIEQIKDFVCRGGTLVLTIRSGMKDEFNSLLPFRQPGPLAEIAGIEIEEFYALQDPVPVAGEWFKGTSNLWAERLKILDLERTTPLAFFGRSNGWLDDRPAVTSHPYGKGTVYFVSAYLDESSQDTLMEHILASAGIAFIPTPTDVEIRQRTGRTGEAVFIMINHSGTERIVPLPWPVHEHLSGAQIQETIKLAPGGIALLTRQSEKAPADEVKGFQEKTIV